MDAKKVDPGKTQTDNFPTYQDEAALTAADKGSVKTVSSADVDPAAAAVVELDHGQESKLAKFEREALEKNPPGGVPAQMLPENQDDTVK